MLKTTKPTFISVHANNKSALRLERYQPCYKVVWDDCVNNAVNEHLLFYRNFMDYHADRFRDHSLLLWKKNVLIGVFPANEDGNTLYSHQGLTFGGLIHREKVYAEDVLIFYDLLNDYITNAGFSRCICKPVPYPYTHCACQAQEFALTLKNARIIERHLSAAVDLRDRISMSELRIRGIKRAIKNNCRVHDSCDFETFISILSAVLNRHNTFPKHTVDELKLLHNRFPENIRLVCVSRGEDMLAGVLLFLTKSAAHLQYICSTDEGQRVGALDLLISTLLDEQQCLRKWFCFGISTEGGGKKLNTGLMHQKEGFGARAFLHEIYELCPGNFL